jgi:hypothetical protein
MKKLLLLALVYSFFAKGNAQQAITNSGNLQVHSGGSLTGFGNFSNAATATLVNNGNMYLRGTLTNDQPSMTAGNGTLYLDGTSSQAVAGAQAFRTNHLNTDNAAGIVLNNNLAVAGVHTFTNGLISSSATPNYLVYEAGSSYAGAADSRHVTGWVKKIGSTDFVFPVGDNNYLRTVALQSISAVSEFNCHYYSPTGNLASLTNPIRMIKANEYWQVNRVSGGSGQVALNWDHAKVPMDNVLLADIVTAYYNGSSWITNGGTATGNVLTTGGITSTSTSSFGRFTFGYRTYPVPLRLISFTAERRQGVSYLQWITDNEQNVGHFDIQRSYDANNYTTIGTIPARNSGVQENYRFDDRSALNGFAWYRIRSVDLDGTFSYTRIAVVSETNASASHFLVLNPVRNAITVFNRTGRAGDFNYRLFSPVGQLILQGTVQISASGGTVLPLPPQIATGVYVLELGDGMTRFRQQLLVER